MIDTKATYDIVGLSKETKDLDDESDIILYAPSTHGGLFIFITIDAAFFLIKKIRSERNNSPEPIHVKIILLPVDSHQQDPLMKWTRWALKKIVFGLPKKIKNGLPGKIKHLSLTSPLPEQSLYNQIYSGKKVQLQRGQDTISFNLFNTTSLRYALLYYSSYINSLALWLTCYQKRHFVAEKFLKLHYQQIPIGDLAASSTLRRKPQLGGSLQPCIELFLDLTNAVGMCKLCKILPLNENKQNYAFFHETTYIPNAYQRTLHHLGANALYYGYKKFEIVNASQPYALNCYCIRQPVSKSCQQEDMSRIEEYMNIRLFEADKKLPYMFGKQNNNLSTKIRDLSGNSVSLNAENLYVVIFLHSFDDAQYWFGLDGFDDLYHWVIFTIDHCLKNSSIDKILIKQHPCIDDPQKFPTDKIAVEKLIQRYGNNERIVFIDKSSSLVFLAKSAHLFGITHHGSVASELVYLHQPVIASACGPWQSFFSFIRTWQNPEEYERILDSLSLKTWSPPSESELKSLFTYLLEYHLNDYRMGITFQNKSWLSQFSKLYSNTDFFEFNDKNYNEYQRVFESLTSEDKIFRDFINILADES